MAISVQTWDGNNINDGTNYITGFAAPITGLPPADVQWAQRNGRHPMVSGVVRPGYTLLLETVIVGATAAKREALRQWFDYEDETPKQLVITGDDGNTQYVYALCEAHYEAGSSAGVGNTFQTVLKVHDDTAWRKTAATTPSNWSITASGQTNGYTNAGEKDAYPLINITPTSAKSGTNQYKRFFAVHWRGDAAVRYPVDIANASLDTRPSTTNFDSTTGADIRVFVDGRSWNFWTSGINTAATKIWVNLVFEKGQTTTLESALGTGTIETIDVDDSISGWGGSGIMQIDNEIFLYSAKNDDLRRFFIESRGAKGSTVASHSAGATVRWIQHDITITYGSLSTAYAVDDSVKPILNLSTSTNASHDYDEFGDSTGLRTAVWKKGIEYSTWAVNYTDNRGANADPWAEIGIYRSRVDLAVNPFFYVHNPVGITSANFQNGEKYAGFGTSQWRGYITSGVSGPNEVFEFSVPVPSAITTWESWSRNETLTAGSRYVGIQLLDTPEGGGTDMYMEAADVTLALNSSNTPVCTIVAEDGNYTLNATLTNTTTEEALAIYFEMDVNETLSINTDTGEVVYLQDGSNQYAAVSRVGGVRRNWLRLQPGSNTWQFTDTGTAGVTIAVSYEERFGA